MRSRCLFIPISRGGGRVAGLANQRGPRITAQPLRRVSPILWPPARRSRSRSGGGAPTEASRFTARPVLAHMDSLASGAASRL